MSAAASRCWYTSTCVRPIQTCSIAASAGRRQHTGDSVSSMLTGTPAAYWRSAGSSSRLVPQCNATLSLRRRQPPLMRGKWLRRQRRLLHCFQSRLLQRWQHIGSDVGSNRLSPRLTASPRGCRGSSEPAWHPQLHLIAGTAFKCSWRRCQPLLVRGKWLRRRQPARLLRLCELAKLLHDAAERRPLCRRAGHARVRQGLRIHSCNCAQTADQIRCCRMSAALQESLPCTRPPGPADLAMASLVKLPVKYLAGAFRSSSEPPVGHKSAVH